VTDDRTAALPREAGPFRLLAELGRGGMGVVYEAEDRRSGRRVALKVLSPDIEYTDEAYQRFEREARLAAAISHPRCVYVLGSHEVDGSPAIAMELMTGETLADRIVGGEAVPVGDAVRWALEMLEGLEAARRAGVIHRDVKPSNCFLDGDGGLKVGDFGLARTLARDVELTVSGQFLGSPLYASPEQVRGEAVDTRSDVYSVGATLYALLAGRPPFEAAGLGELLSKVLTEEPEPLRSLRREVPRGLARIVRRAMSKDRRHRPADPRALARALRPWVPTRDPAPGSARLRAGLGDAGRLLGAMLAVGASVAVYEVAASAVGDGAAGTDRSQVGLTFGVLFWLLMAGYFPLLEGLRAASPGKRGQGLRIVDSATGVPCPWRAAARGLIHLLLVVGGVLALVSLLPPAETWTWLPAGARAPVSAVLTVLAGWTLPLSTCRRANGRRGVHGLLTRTRVVRALPPPADAVPSGAWTTLDPVPDADLPERVDGHAVEGRLGVTPWGTVLLGRDEQLGRSVWLHLASTASTAPALPPGSALGQRDPGVPCRGPALNTPERPALPGWSG